MAQNRWTRTRLYLVLSYVTKPTTIKAITEIPANTARPMGKTESCFPGIWNAGAGELELAVSACVVPVGSLDVDVPDPSLGFPPEFAPGVGDDPEAEEELAESAAAEAVESEPEADEAEDAEDADEEAAEAAADDAAADEDAAPDDAGTDDAALAGMNPDTLARGIDVRVP